ncbi:MAG: DUF1934 domain-containing protein [Ruminococcus sp.]|nr:DUF1934 domain-containing protein [Ruminococcus sp.]MEE0857815.1 DUF1934 domain-containing protein [Ruminococcus sp.]MEE1172105.1 DUF1934 domain-containing protein [Ruminococcus sp.]
MANTDKFLISIIGKQTVDGESDRVEVITTGKFMKKSDRWFIGYKEYSQDEPLSHYDNLIKVDGDIVTISRKGEIRSQLILELNKRHQCIYSTPAGNMTIGVFTRSLVNHLTENGGMLEVNYTLDFNSDMVSENSFRINIEKQANEV